MATTTKKSEDAGRSEWEILQERIAGNVVGKKKKKEEEEVAFEEEIVGMIAEEAAQLHMEKKQEESEKDDLYMDDEMDAFEREYLQRRMAAMKRNQQQQQQQLLQNDGNLLFISSKAEFVANVTQSSCKEGQYKIVLLLDITKQNALHLLRSDINADSNNDDDDGDNIGDRKKMSLVSMLKSYQQFAKAHSNVVCTMMYFKDCNPNIPVITLPCILVYKQEKCIKTFAHVFNGLPIVNSNDFEWILSTIGVCETSLKEDPRLTTSNRVFINIKQK